MKKISIGMILFLGLCAAAQTVKQAPPPGTPPRPASVAGHETYNLPNGMKVTLAPYGYLPKVHVTVAVNAGTANQGRDQGGVAYLTADLLKEGTTNLTPDQLEEQCSRTGGLLATTADEDQTTASLDVLSEFGPTAARLLADIVMHPSLPETELSRVKSDEIRQSSVFLASPVNLAHARLRKVIYGDHPYGELRASEDEINKVTIQQIRDFYGANYAPQRAHIYVAGQFDKAAMKKAIAESFGKWTRGQSEWTQNVPAPAPHPVLDFTDRPGAQQSSLMIGLPVVPPNHPDAIPLNVTSVLLGGAWNSRVMADLREKKGYSYSPYCWIISLYHNSYWQERADVTNEFTGPSIQVILDEIDRLQTEPPAAAEIKNAQNFVSGSFIIENLSRDAFVNQLRTIDLQGLGDDYLQTYIAKVNAVTPADVQRMARQYLQSKDMTIIVVGDKTKIGDQLKPFRQAN